MSDEGLKGLEAAHLRLQLEGVFQSSELRGSQIYGVVKNAYVLQCVLHKDKPQGRDQIVWQVLCLLMQLL